MISDEELMAYVDGELDAAASARIAGAVATDPQFAARVASQRALRDRLQAHFAPVLDEPLPAALRELPVLRTPAEGRRRWRWQEWSAMAATLVLGVLLGPFVLRSSQPLPFMSANGRVVAIGDLESALMQQNAGQVDPRGGRMAIGMSFRTTGGEYCRTFAMNPGPAGLACREWGEWVVEVLARNPKARQGAGGDAYRQAGTAFPPAIRTAVEARIDGEPLTAAEETEAAGSGWRAGKR